MARILATGKYAGLVSQRGEIASAVSLNGWIVQVGQVGPGPSLMGRPLALLPYWVSARGVVAVREWETRPDSRSPQTACCPSQFPSSIPLRRQWRW
jgi:hypothetical protein